MMLRPQPEPAWKLAKQAGVDYAVTGVSGLHAQGGITHGAVAALKARFADAGLTLYVIEGDPLPMDRIKLGLPGRDDDIRRYCDLVSIMGELGIPVMCYNWMAQIGWYRTSTTTPSRGGALACSFDYDAVRNAPPTPAGVVPEERLWDTLKYFLERVLPAAEKAGVQMALHPDDPPVSPLMGVGRILTSVAAFDRVLDTFPSKANGLTFCQGTFATMGGDVYEAIRHFSTRGKIFFAHFRDVRGTAARFVETFHDDGQTDMLRAMRCYVETGYDGPMRPDHAPTMEGEPNDRPGYGVMGRIYGVGYMKGLLTAVERERVGSRL